MYEEYLESFQDTTKVPTQFLEADENFCDAIKNSLKKLYDFAKDEEIRTIECNNALQELILQDFDLEQVWQEIELQNDSIITPLLTVVSKLIANKSGPLFNNQISSLSKEGNVDKNLEIECDGTESEKSVSDKVKNGEDDEMAEGGEDEVNFESEGSNDIDENMENKANKSMKTSSVDDRFFKLSEMEKFLETEEKKLNDPDSGNDSDDQSEFEGSVDLFVSDVSDDDPEHKMKTAKYKDFFGARKATDRKFTLDEVDNEEYPQSSFHSRQSRLGKKIEEIEVEAVKEKSWQLKGEVTAENRPQNSLLEEIVEFDSTTRPAPVMTEKATMQLEDIIRQRIKDRTFDSVERKIKSAETPYDYKKKLMLDQEKSKDSLAQIYEREFLEQQAALKKGNEESEEKEPELHQEINSLMRNLFVKLDALSNFHFTPKPAIPELKVVSNLPAVSMEEVVPVAMSDAALLAPEEIKTKTKGDIVGKNERTSTDKKRERRRKKLKQKIHAKEKQKKETSNSMKKKGNQLSKKRKIDESGGCQEIKSSKAFFTQLQAEVHSHIKGKSVSRQSKGGENVSNAKKLKL